MLLEATRAEVLGSRASFLRSFGSDEDLDLLGGNRGGEHAGAHAPGMSERQVEMMERPFERACITQDETHRLVSDHLRAQVARPTCQLQAVLHDADGRVTVAAKPLAQ